MLSLMKSMTGRRIRVGGPSKMIRGGFGLVAVLASAWLGAGCTTTETLQGPSPLDTEDGFCQALATAECSAPLVSSCYDVSEKQTATLQTDTSRCVAAASRTDVCNPTGLPYHSEAAQKAIDTITGIYADGVLTSDELPSLNAALATVFNRGEGEKSRCQVDSDCDATNGLTCILHGGNGICGDARVVKVGASCAVIDASCDETSYCAKIVGGGSVCVDKRKAQSSCAGDYECVSGTHCADGHCHELVQDGDTCTLGTDCANSFCLKKSSDDKTGFCASQDKFDPFSSSCDVYR